MSAAEILLADLKSAQAYKRKIPTVLMVTSVFGRFMAPGNKYDSNWTGYTPLLSYRFESEGCAFFYFNMREERGLRAKAGVPVLFLCKLAR